MKDNKDNFTIMKALSMLTQLGLNMAACVIVGFFLGRFLDRLFNTAPWLMIIFVFLGVAAAFKVLFEISKNWK